MNIILDTCVIINAERKEKHSLSIHNKIFEKLEKYENAYISAITVSELLVGAHRATINEQRLKRIAIIESILAEISVLDFTTEIARLHAEICAHLAKKGKMIGAHDLIIAATALSNDCAVLTSNHSEFKRVPGLEVEVLNL